MKTNRLNVVLDLWEQIDEFHIGGQQQRPGANRAQVVFAVQQFELDGGTGENIHFIIYAPCICI